MPFFSDTESWIWFDYAKRYSIIIPLFFYSLSQFCHERRENRFSKLQPTKPFSSVITAFFFSLMRGDLIPKFIRSQVILLPFILVANIVEVNITALLSGATINAVIGVILLVTIPRFWGQWYFDQSSLLGFGKYPDWCIVYTLWNAHFIQLQAGLIVQKTYISLMVILLINLLVCVIFKNWHMWLFVRAFTLEFVMSITSFFSELIPTAYWTISHKWLNISAYLILLPSIYLVYKTIKEKRSCLVYYRKIEQT